jgi:hypothetical protein
VPEPFTALELAGHRDLPLPCLLHGTGDEASTAVVLPGGSRHGGMVGGTPARPDLAYAGALLRSLGLAVLEVWWRTDELPRGAALDDWLHDNANAAFAAAVEHGPVRVVVARSLGTMALARSFEGADGAATVWLAPLVREPGVAAAIEACGARAFVVAGGADALWDAQIGDGIGRTGARVHVLADADHSLGVDDPAESARLLADVLDELRKFLRAAGVGESS